MFFKLRQCSCILIVQGTCFKSCYFWEVGYLQTLNYTISRFYHFYESLCYGASICILNFRQICFHHVILYGKRPYERGQRKNDSKKGKMHTVHVYVDLLLKLKQRKTGLLLFIFVFLLSEYTV